MESLSQKLIDNISSEIKGNKLKKFLASVDIINQSLSLGGWIPRGRVKGETGFYQGLFDLSRDIDYKGKDRSSDLWKDINALIRLISYGVLEKEDLDIPKLMEKIRESNKIKTSNETIVSWFELVKEKEEAFKRLDAYRKLPSVTKIGASPRVTQTLEHMKMDSEDSYSIKLAKLKRNEKWVKEKLKNGKEIKKIIVWYTVDWSDEIQHNHSRFSVKSNHCEACGKNIPSGRFVAMEMHQGNGSIFSMWVGTDCANNLFGIKDVGIQRL